VLGWAIGVAVAAMLGGLLGGAVALGHGEYAGAGVCFLAAGVSAGLLANAVLRS
jgi:hypothetical protein